MSLEVITGSNGKKVYEDDIKDLVLKIISGIPKFCEYQKKFFRAIALVGFTIYEPSRKLREISLVKIQRFWRRASGFAAYEEMYLWAADVASAGMLPAFTWARFSSSACAEGGCKKSPHRFLRRVALMKDERYFNDALLVGANAAWYAGTQKRTDGKNFLTTIGNPPFSRTEWTLCFLNGCVCGAPSVNNCRKFLLQKNCRLRLYSILAGDGIPPRLRGPLSYHVRKFCRLLGTSPLRAILRSL